jgi:two-component system CheB/CheR fusion protein
MTNFRDPDPAVRTEWERLEAAWLASEARFRAIIEKNADGVIVIGEDGRIRYANPAAEKLFGQPYESLLDSPFGVPVMPGETTELDLPHHGPDPDGLGPLIAELRVVSTEWDGQPAILASLRDVTERKRAEAAIRSAEERFRLASEAISDFTYSFRVRETGLELEWLTDAFTRMTGYSGEEVVRGDWYQLVEEKDRERVQRHFANVISGQPDACEVRMTTRDGQLRWLRFAARPAFDLEGRVTRIYGAGQDVSERRHLEEELRDRVGELAEADRRKDEFLALLAHELRNPLAAIRNALEVLRRTSLDGHPSPLRELIENQTIHLARLVDDLLDVSRITRGKIQLRSNLTDFGRIVARSIDALRLQIADRGLTLTITSGPGTMAIEADPDRIQQVISNLLHNAMKFTEPGGSIHVETCREGDQVVLRVRDTGIGIDPDKLTQIFDLFTQVDARPSRTGGGLGIGLTLARQLVVMHGGDLEAHSEGQGHGSEFIVRLPVSSRTPSKVDPFKPVRSRTEEAPTPAVAPSSIARLRVLLVDDNVDAARSLGILLGFWGHDVRLVHDGPAALDAVPDYEPDVVLLDIGLPRLDGYAVASLLRSENHNPSLLIIAMTGYGQEEDRRRSVSAGFDHHLVKPIDLHHLEHLLAEHAERIGSAPLDSGPR